MNRITAERVLAAYEKTGVKPMFEDWYSLDRSCACAIGAIYLAEHGSEACTDTFLRSEYTGIFNTIEKSINTSQYYIRGFVEGFDYGEDASYCSFQAEDYRIGIDDGKLAQLAVLEKYPELRGSINE